MVAAQFGGLFGGPCGVWWLSPVCGIRVELHSWWYAMSDAWWKCVWVDVIGNRVFVEPGFPQRWAFPEDVVWRLS